MKKYLLLIFLLCLMINIFKVYNAESCENYINLENVNSLNLINYIKENNLTTKITRVCSSDICMNINPSQIERDIKSFIQKNMTYLKNKVDENTYLSINLKGFKITKIIMNSCA